MRVSRNVMFIPLPPSGYFPYLRGRVCEVELFD